MIILYYAISALFLMILICLFIDRSRLLTVRSVWSVWFVLGVRSFHLNVFARIKRGSSAGEHSQSVHWPTASLLFRSLWLPIGQSRLWYVRSNWECCQVFPLCTLFHCSQLVLCGERRFPLLSVRSLDAFLLCFRLVLSVYERHYDRKQAVEPADSFCWLWMGQWTVDGGVVSESGFLPFVRIAECYAHCSGWKYELKCSLTIATLHRMWSVDFCLESSRPSFQREVCAGAMICRMKKRICRRRKAWLARRTCDVYRSGMIRELYHHLFNPFNNDYENECLLEGSVICILCLFLATVLSICESLEFYLQCSFSMR